MDIHVARKECDVLYIRGGSILIVRDFTPFVYRHMFLLFIYGVFALTLSLCCRNLRKKHRISGMNYGWGFVTSVGKQIC